MTSQLWTHVGRQQKRARILLVEDEPFVREATRGILENAGFEVLPAEDADAALRASAVPMSTF